MVIIRDVNSLINVSRLCSLLAFCKRHSFSELAISLYESDEFECTKYPGTSCYKTRDKYEISNRERFQPKDMNS